MDKVFNFLERFGDCTWYWKCEGARYNERILESLAWKRFLKPLKVSLFRKFHLISTEFLKKKKLFLRFLLHALLKFRNFLYNFITYSSGDFQCYYIKIKAIKRNKDLFSFYKSTRSTHFTLSNLVSTFSTIYVEHESCLSTLFRQPTVY